MISFQNMPSHSRIWIYQSNRELSAAELSEIKSKAEIFVSQWTSHDQMMKACIEFFYNRFIVVVVDEKTASASGCGIDKSVRFIQQLEKDHSLNLTDRMQVAFKQADKISSCSLSEFEKMLAEGKLNSETIVFNNLAANKAEMTTLWEIPVKESWHKRLVKS